MTPARKRLWPIAALVAGLAGSPVALSCQVVVGDLRAAEDGEPLAGALVLLIDTLGKPQGRFVTDPMGRFVLRAPAAGSYRLEAQRIGYRSARSPVLQLGGDTVTYHFTVLAEPIALPGIEVTSGKRGCERRPDAPEVATVWGEIRKALDVTRWTEQLSGMAYTRQLYRHVVDERRQLLFDAVGSTAEADARLPFSTATPVDLAARGFGTTANGEMALLGPDAEVLTSDDFLNGHCFSLVASAHDPGAVGLRFEPLARRLGFIDISGTLWVQRPSGTLQRLEYSYTNLPSPYSRSGAGGEVGFERLQNGLWIVRSWRIRSPSLLLERGRSGFQRITTEAGGTVLRAAQGANSLYAAPVGSIIEGIVRSQPGGGPLEGAQVILGGTSYNAISDANGHYRIANVPAGRYAIGFSHPLTRDLRVPVRMDSVTVGQSTVIQHDLTLAALNYILRVLCLTSRPQPTTPGLVYGFVTDATGKPVVTGVPRARWKGSGKPEELARDGEILDLRGLYVICWVPRGQELLVQFRQRETTVESTAVVPLDGLAVKRLDITWH